MAENKSGTTESAGLLLSAQEREVFTQISAGEAPHSQRAQALLAIDEGVTQAAAAEGAGLTIGQVKYWLAKFRNLGLVMFPEDALVEPELAAAGEAPEVKTKNGVKGKKKSKKGKKGKKDTKRKKGKKDKKGKKGKKGKKK